MGELTALLAGTSEREDVWAVGRRGAKEPMERHVWPLAGPVDREVAQCDDIEASIGVDVGELLPRGLRHAVGTHRGHNALAGVPVMSDRENDSARRFVNLVDEFYDRNVKLVIAAAAPPESIYRGTSLTFEFQRTASRLREMQGQDYLARQHMAA